MKIAIIGMGNMGSKYAAMILKNDIKDMELVAFTRVNEERLEGLKQYLPSDFVIYNSGDDLLEAYDNKEVEFDAVLIVTPHYSHEKYTVAALERGLSVLCDKPAGVYSRQGRIMEEAYEKAKIKKTDIQYGFIFHQRTIPVYRKMKEIVESGIYGKIKRVNWIVTDWYRTDAYYASGSWRATWRSDGGGTLINQCPHNIDLIQWICGVPKSVVGFSHEGKYHPIEVEDDVTAYMEWENGATGVFIASTGEAAGVNRFEISLEDALLICDKGKLSILKLDKPESEYKKNTTDLFAKPKAELVEVECGTNEPYIELLSAFAKGEMISTGLEAMNSLYITNAIYLSSWKNTKIDLPSYGTEYEKDFETMYESELDKKING